MAEHQQPRPFTSTQRLINAGLIRGVKEICSSDVAIDELAHCPYCDAGPAHGKCLISHMCPTIHTSPSGKGGRGLLDDDPSFEGEESDGEAHMVDTPPGTPRLKAPRLVDAAAYAKEFGKHPSNQPLARAMDRELSHGAAASKLASEVSTPLTMKGHLRSTEPAVKPYARGSLFKVQQVEQDNETFRKAMEDFTADKLALSNQESFAARLKWWEQRAAGQGLAPFPLTVAHINVAGALLKAGSYRSSPQYFAALKRQHISLGHSWSDALQLAVKDAIRSCTRGQGPDRQCPSIDLRKLASS